jgi:phosphate transporter
MGLPFSSFPNVNSVLIVDDFHHSYLTVADFLRIGVPLTLIATLLIGTLGYALIMNFVL